MTINEINNLVKAFLQTKEYLNNNTASNPILQNIKILAKQDEKTGTYLLDLIVNDTPILSLDYNRLLKAESKSYKNILGVLNLIKTKPEILINTYTDKGILATIDDVNLRHNLVLLQQVKSLGVFLNIPSKPVLVYEQYGSKTITKIYTTISTSALNLTTLLSYIKTPRYYSLIAKNKKDGGISSFVFPMVLIDVLKENYFVNADDFLNDLYEDIETVKNKSIVVRNSNYYISLPFKLSETDASKFKFFLNKIEAKLPNGLVTFKPQLRTKAGAYAWNLRDGRFRDMAVSFFNAVIKEDWQELAVLSLKYGNNIIVRRRKTEEKKESNYALDLNQDYDNEDDFQEEDEELRQNSKDQLEDYEGDDVLENNRQDEDELEEERLQKEDLANNSQTSITKKDELSKTHFKPRSFKKLN